MESENRTAGPALRDGEADWASEFRGAEADAEHRAPIFPRPACHYELCQAIALLESRFPGSPRIGHRGPAVEERIRLRPNTSFAFPAAEVESAKWKPGALTVIDRVELTVNLFGLVGSTTPLPLVYPREVMWTEDDEPHVRDFLDLFHHRLLSLLYRTWYMNRYESIYEAGCRDALSRALLALVGLRDVSEAEKNNIEPETILRYLALWILPSRPADGLETILEEELGYPILVEQFTSRWIEIPLDQCFRVRGRPGEIGYMGRDIHVGTRMRDCSGCIRVKIGPMAYAQVSRFRPGEPLYERAKVLIQFYIRQPLDAILECLVLASDMPSLPLGGVAPGKLGHTSYMGRPKEGKLEVAFDIPAVDATGS